MNDDRLYIGIKGHVVCLDKRNGQEVWRTQVRSSVLTTVVIDEAALFVYAGGHLFCLCAETGAVVWENELPGLGYGHCIIATAGNQGMATAAVQQAQAQQAAASAAAANRPGL
jgi:outer membrane protein assembly factor BamB